MSIQTKGNLLKNPLSSEKVLVKDLKKYLKDENNIVIYLDEDPIPYCMKRTYFINLLAEDFDYECNSRILYHQVNTDIKYYNLSKLFLNVKGQPQIIIKMNDIIQIMTDSNITHFKLTSVKTTFTKQPIKKLTYTNIDLKKRNYKEDSDYDVDHGDTPKKWAALEWYCAGGYFSINKYLVRLTDMPNHIGMVELPAFLFQKVISLLGLSKEKTNALVEPRKEDTVIQSYIDDIDHIFYKYAKKSKEQKVVYRGMSSFYTYLKQPGDKMVIENYISCFEEGGGLPGSPNVLCKITIEPGIPYFEIYLDKEFQPYKLAAGEGEVLLPRNLVATYHGEDEHHEKLITVSPLYPSQFRKKLVCNKRVLYKIQKSNDDTFQWKTIRGGTRKKTKTSLRHSIKK